MNESQLSTISKSRIYQKMHVEGWLTVSNLDILRLIRLSTEMFFSKLLTESVHL